MNIGCYTVGAGHTNCYCVAGEGYAFIVDPAYPAKEILEFAKANTDKAHKYILLTHCHIDHIEGVEAVKEIWSCPVIISEDDAAGLENPQINLSRRLFGYDLSLSADVTVEDGDKIDLGCGEICVMATPGHTVGSVCYIFKDIMFSGDTLFSGTIGRTDVPTSDTSAMLGSLKRLQRLETDYKVYPGHGGATTIFCEKKFNSFMRF